MRFYLAFGFSATVTVLCLFAAIFGASHGIQGMGPGFGALTLLSAMATLAVYYIPVDMK